MTARARPPLHCRSPRRRPHRSPATACQSLRAPRGSCRPDRVASISPLPRRPPPQKCGGCPCRSRVSIPPPLTDKKGAWGNTTPTDPRSRRNRANRRGANRRGGQLLTRALGSSNLSACPHLVLPVPLSRMVAPYARTIRSRLDRSAPPTFILVTNIARDLI